MDALSPRVERRVRRDFPLADPALELVRAAGPDERVQASVVLWAQGDWSRLVDAAELAKRDWRDALVRGGLADDDWQSRLDDALGPPGCGTPVAPGPGGRPVA